MTNQIEVAEHVGEVEINSQTYRLVRLKGQQLAYSIDYYNQPPWTRNVLASGNTTPAMLSEVQSSWHLGGFKSQTGIPNTSAYGINSDGRYPFKLVPAPATTLIGNALQAVTSFFTAFGYVWAVAGVRVWRIDPTTNAMVLSLDRSGPPPIEVVTEGVFWEGAAYVSGSVNLWKLTSANPDVWTSTAAFGPLDKPYRFAKGVNRLYMINFSSVLKNISTGLDPMIPANYADSVKIGDNSAAAGELIAYNRTVVINMYDGLYGVGEEGFGVPLVRRVVPDIWQVYRHPTIMEPWIVFPHPRGMYRWQPGLVQSVGIENEVLNQTPVRGNISAVKVDGDWLYAILDTGLPNHDQYFLVGREKRAGEQSFGPIIWDTLAYIGGGGVLAGALHTYAETSSGVIKVYFSSSSNVRMIKLSAAGGAPDIFGSDITFATSGSRYMPTYRFDDWGEKDFPKVAIVTANTDANNYWTVNYSIDGAAYSNLDVNGSVMRANLPGRVEFVLPQTAHGREITYRLDFVCDGTHRPTVTQFEPFAMPAPRSTPIVKCHLLLADNLRYGTGEESRTYLEQYNDLVALAGQAAAVTVSAPWGENILSNIKDCKLVQASQAANRSQEFIVQVEIQQRITV